MNKVLLVIAVSFLSACVLLGAQHNVRKHPAIPKPSLGRNADKPSVSHRVVHTEGLRSNGIK